MARGDKMKSGGNRKSLFRGMLERLTPGIGAVKKSGEAIGKRGEVAGLSDVDGSGGDKNDGMKNRDAILNDMIRKKRARRKARF